jgi:hypothetical protein
VSSEAIAIVLVVKTTTTMGYERLKAAMANPLLPVRAAIEILEGAAEDESLDPAERANARALLGRPVAPTMIPGADGSAFRNYDPPRDPVAHVKRLIQNGVIADTVDLDVEVAALHIDRVSRAELVRLLAA